MGDEAEKAPLPNSQMEGTLKVSLYHTNSHGPEEAAVRRAVSHSARLAEQTGQSECRIAVHTKNPFLMGVFSKAFGASFVKAAASVDGGYLAGCRFFVITEKIEGPAREDSPIVAAHVSFTWLESLIADQRNADVIYLPWTNDELRAYLAAHSESEEI